MQTDGLTSRTLQALEHEVLHAPLCVCSAAVLASHPAALRLKLVYTLANPEPHTSSHCCMRPAACTSVLCALEPRRLNGLHLAYLPAHKLCIAVQQAGVYPCMLCLSGLQTPITLNFAAHDICSKAAAICVHSVRYGAQKDGCIHARRPNHQGMQCQRAGGLCMGAAEYQKDQGRQQ